MRINNPKLFNGDLLATKKQITTWLQGVASEAFTGLLSTSVIPIVGLSAEYNTTLSANVFPVYAETIKIGKADETTIKDAIDAITSSVAAVTVYDVDAATNHAISITPSSWVSGEIPHKKFTVGLDLADNSLTQSASGLKITDGHVEGIASGIAQEIEVVKLGSATEGYASSYEVHFNGVKLGETINIPKDQFLSGVTYDPETTTLNFTFILPDGPSITPVNIGSLVDTYTAGDGLQVNNNEFSGVVDPTSDSYLTVGANGFKLSGVSAAIVDLQAADEYISGKVDAISGDVVELRSDVDELSGKVTSVDKFIKVADFPASGETDKEALYYTNEGQSRIWNDNSWQTISMEALTSLNGTVDDTTVATSKAIKDYVTGYVDSEVVPVLTGLRTDLDTVSGDLDTLESTVTGIRTDLDTVSGNLNTVSGDLDTLESTVDDIRTDLNTVSGNLDIVSGVVSGITDDLPKKAEIFTVSRTFGNTTPATVPGRVIAVYDSTNAQCYPDITYANNASTLSASDLASTETFTVVYVTATEQAGPAQA